MAELFESKKNVENGIIKRRVYNKINRIKALTSKKSERVIVAPIVE